ncbi:MAG: hypothetical protein K6U03_08365 [Firmicutes bacterium]|nr:hypothetical protein [Bacillota bacterium]
MAVCRDCGRHVASTGLVYCPRCGCTLSERALCGDRVVDLPLRVFPLRPLL